MTDIAASLRRVAENVRGCCGAFAMDYEGLPLEVVRTDAGGPDLDPIGAELATVLRDAGQAGHDLGLGPLEGLSVRDDGPTLVFRACGPDILLAAVLDRASSAAVARRALAQAARPDPGGP